VTGPYVALLRGINVGGRNMLPMRDLTAIFTDVGCVDVTTYIQSGNVIFRAPAKLANQIPRLIADGIAERFNLRIPVVTRSAAELERVVACNPYLGIEPDFTKLHVVFLADLPSPAASSALDPDRSPPDSFEIQGGEIYLHLPNGAATTKLSNAYFDSKLGTTSTARNWKTVLKLNELAGAPAT
jgi:uncharacterized protein (DUF1697 family)